MNGLITIFGIKKLRQIKSRIMRKIVTLACALSLGLASMGQVAADSSNWKTGGLVSLNFSQVSLSQGWAGGGQSAVSVNGFLNVFANYAKGKGTWDNNLDLGYGIISQNKSRFFKNDDRIDLSSKYGRHAFKNWYYSLLGNFRSQFAPGYSDPVGQLGKISNWMAPGYLLGAAGMDFKPNENFTLFISPVTTKHTFVKDADFLATGGYGVAAGETHRGEFGGYLKMMWKRDLMENVFFQTKADFFSNYTNNPGNLDVTWENMLTMKINSFLAASFGTLLIYDEDIDIAYDKLDPTKLGPRAQFKQVLAVGLSRKF